MANDLLKSKLISNDKIELLVNGNEYAEAAKLLLKLQLMRWELLSENYKNLNFVKIKSYDYGSFRINLQYNPARIKSTTAGSEKAIEHNSKCILCYENLPAEQKAIIILDSFLILCNPFPIFPAHFTIAKIKHRPQEIESSFNDLLLLSKFLHEHYTVVYNGPKCGASEPEHLHFQAGTKQFMPIENEFSSLQNEFGEIIFDNDSLTISAVDDGLRKFISFESSNDIALLNSFNQFYKIYKNIQIRNREPMMNIICNYEVESGWRVIVFLRSKHRSKHYFDDDVLLSPAVVDLGGVCVTPEEKDFNRINRLLLKEILSEVSLYKEGFEYIISSMKDNISF